LKKRAEKVIAILTQIIYIFLEMDMKIYLEKNIEYKMAPKRASFLFENFENL
jgi:hypothetical protein